MESTQMTTERISVGLTLTRSEQRTRRLHIEALLEKAALPICKPHPLGLHGPLGHVWCYV